MGGRAAGGIALLLLALALAWSGRARAASGVEWVPVSVDSALAQSARDGRIVMVDVYSAHCGFCHRMQDEVWSTPRAEDLTAGLIAVHVESHTPEGADIIRRDAVTVLPTVLFLRADGSEIDRISGYDGAARFFQDADPMSRGIDSIIAMQDTLHAHPDSLALLLRVMEKDLDRGREAQASPLLDHIVAIDADDHGTFAERALARMAQYQETRARNWQASYDDWRHIAEHFPGSSLISAAMDGTARLSRTMGTMREWAAWACDLAARNESLGKFQYAVAMAAHGNGLTGGCFLKAAEAARAAGAGDAHLDSVVVELERK